MSGRNKSGKRVLHTRGSGNLIWSTLTWSMRGTHIRFGNTMSEAMMSMIVSSDNELERGTGEIQKALHRPVRKD